MGAKYDFDGWATKNDILCTDGRIIRRDAFKDDDGAKVPLVFQHSHDDPSNVLGFVKLYNEPEGVWCQASFNNTQKAQDVKEMVRHGDLNALSIYANKLKQNGREVLHGSIKEVSIVLSGANSGAKIENLYFEHADGSFTVDDGEAIMNFYEPIHFIQNDELSHSEEKEDKKMPSDKTVQDVVDSMTDEQKNVMMFLVAKALEEQPEDEDEDDDYDEEDDDFEHSDMEEYDMRYNTFDGGYDEDVLTHSELDFRNEILEMMSADNRNRTNISSLKNEILAHADEYGIEDIEWLFPDARTLANTPEFIKRDDTWVDIFMNGTKHIPFTRVKTMFADITADEARAKGYTKKNKKVEEVITLLRRSVGPCTVYKKQKLDRDDILDITDFDVVVWLKSEMRMLLNEEIARAALVGDGRSNASSDKIKEDCIIPIWKDDDLFTVSGKITLKSNATADEKADAVIEKLVRARKDYRGSGNLTFFTTEDTLNDMLLMKDGVGHRLYKNVGELCAAMRVNRIVTVPVMENLTRTVELPDHSTETRNLIGIAVDLIDYNFGSDKGGAVNMFDDFDIDFNQFKYLMETRCSGALVKPYSAIIVESVTANG